ncbi:MAG: tail fiber domain-containing protein, partial [Chitinophagales bacterium]
NSALVILLAIFILRGTQSNAQNANTTLSNLTSPTAINLSLFPASSATTDLGSASNKWRDVYLDGFLYLDGTKFLSNGAGSGSTMVGASSGMGATGSSNTFYGNFSGFNTTSGYGNTFMGVYAGKHNVAGNQNICIGYLTGGVGIETDLGSNNTYVGSQISSVTAGITNATGIGYNADVTVSSTARIGSSITRIGIGKECSSSSILEFSATTAKLTSGGTWTNASDKRLKENMEAMDKQNILEKVNQLNITKWNYKVDRDRKYIGPMAQDFHQLFDVGDDTTISTIDPSGIALLAVQALSEEIKLLKEKNNKLQVQIDELNTTVFGNTMVDGAAKITISNEKISSLLGQNIPNPFENNTLIPFRIPKGCISASIVISEAATGRIITAIPTSCNETHVLFESATLDAGNYIYSLFVDGKAIDTKQMQLFK